MKLDKLSNITGYVWRPDLHQNLSIPKQILFILCLNPKFTRDAESSWDAFIQRMAASWEHLFSYILFTFKLYLLEKKDGCYVACEISF